VRPARVEEAQRMSEDSGRGVRPAAMVASMLYVRVTPRARESEAEGENERDGESKGRRLPFFSSTGRGGERGGKERATWRSAPACGQPQQISSSNQLDSKVYKNTSETPNFTLRNS